MAKSRCEIGIYRFTQKNLVHKIHILCESQYFHKIGFFVRNCLKFAIFMYFLKKMCRHIWGKFCCLKYFRIIEQSVCSIMKKSCDKLIPNDPSVTTITFLFDENHWNVVNHTVLVFEVSTIRWHCKQQLKQNQIINWLLIKTNMCMTDIVCNLRVVVRWWVTVCLMVCWTEPSALWPISETLNRENRLNL